MTLASGVQRVTLHGCAHDAVAAMCLATGGLSPSGGMTMVRLHSLRPTPRPRGSFGLQLGVCASCSGNLALTNTEPSGEDMPPFPLQNAGKLSCEQNLPHRTRRGRSVGVSVQRRTCPPLSAQLGEQCFWSWGRGAVCSEWEQGSHGSPSDRSRGAGHFPTNREEEEDGAQVRPEGCICIPEWRP